MTERKIALSIEEAADYTGIGRNTLRKLVEWKKLPVLKVGRKVLMLAPGAHSQFGSGKNTQFEPEQRANPFENVFSKTAVFPPPAIAETDL